SDRDDHSFIGMFTDASQPIRYLAASTSRDSDPVWSADGRLLAFVRQPGRGGTPRSALAQQPQPWSIVVTGAAGTAPAPDTTVAADERDRARVESRGDRRRPDGGAARIGGAAAAVAGGDADWRRPTPRAGRRPRAGGVSIRAPRHAGAGHVQIGRRPGGTRAAV